MKFLTNLGSLFLVTCSYILPYTPALSSAHVYLRVPLETALECGCEERCDCLLDKIPEEVRPYLLPFPTSFPLAPSFTMVRAAIQSTMHLLASIWKPCIMLCGLPDSRCVRIIVHPTVYFVWPATRRSWKKCASLLRQTTLKGARRRRSALFTPRTF